MLKKYITHQNQKGKVYAIKDFTLDCIQKMTDTAHRENVNDRRGDESHVSISKNIDTTSMQMTIADRASCLQDGLKIHKTFHVP